MDNYYEKCASCKYTDLNEKFCGKFYCTRLKTYFVWNEKACSYYEEYHRSEQIEKARERLG